MKWRGETQLQWEERTSDWHRHFCLFPRQMRNGNWVWMEYCWTRRRNTLGGGWYFEFSDAVTMPEDVCLKTVPPGSLGFKQ